ncbi:MAG: PKD domain-containing protein [Terriglobia bacterium]
MIRRLLDSLSLGKLTLAALLIVSGATSGVGQQTASIRNEQLTVTVNIHDGSYAIRAKGLEQPVLVARVGAKIDHTWVRSDQYPKQEAEESSFEDDLGSGRVAKITLSGLAGKPDLICSLRLYDHHPYGDLEVTLRNTTGKALIVEALRMVEAAGRERVNLGGAAAADRVLSDSFSEDRPVMQILDLAKAPDGVHRGAGSQLIYNRESKQSLFLATLTSRRFLNVFHLRVENSGGGEPKITSYTADSTGTTEIEMGESLKGSPKEDQMELSLPVEAGQELASERTMFAAGNDYHAQLEAYGDAIRILHHARVTAPNPIGWWSWTAFYGGISEAPTLTNLRWLAENLKEFGYEYFFIDEGYQYARGEYETPNATQFPDGMRYVGHQVCKQGLTFGIWTAPFEVTARAWVYEHHQDWLVHNGQGKPIEIGFVGQGKSDPIFVLDTTNPGAQAYLRKTYQTLTRDWGVRLIKMDFMDDTAVEGLHYRPNTTALEAQRIGLQIIREAVGENVLLDKDGSPMLNPVGIVDIGRISVDTGHAFRASRDAAPGIAARYYMHRNWFLDDPDAFTVGAQRFTGQRWHTAKEPITLTDAEVSIALAAVSGGMFELGDDMPLLSTEPERLALVKNPDLLQMAKLGRASLPIDLMTYNDEDKIPSVNLLKEDRRQAVLTVFNWTDGARSHTFTLADLGLPMGDSYQASSVFDNGRSVEFAGGKLTLENQPAHSVRMIKIIDTSVPAAAPTISVDAPSTAETGAVVKFSATAEADGVPAIAYHWDFGDGTTEDAAQVNHAFTEEGSYTIQLKVDGVDGIAAERTFTIGVNGMMNWQFDLPNNRRYVE